VLSLRCAAVAGAVERSALCPPPAASRTVPVPYLGLAARSAEISRSLTGRARSRRRTAVGPGVLDLWRYRGGSFQADELRLLATLARPVTAGLRAAIARTFVDPGRHLHPIGPAVVVLDPGLQVRSQTEAAAEALLRLNPPEEPMAPIPAAAYNIAAALIAQEYGMPIGPPWSRIHLGGSRWVTVKASRLGTDIAGSIEPSTAADRLDLYARACGLTRRESEVLGLLCEGLDTREIAGQMVVSEHTASDHLKAILAKTGARTRQLLLARGLGTR